MLLLLSILCFFPCATIAPAHAGLFDVGEKQELSYGRKADDQIRHESIIDEDYRVNALVRDVGESLVPYTDRPEIHYTFRVIDDNSVNAFSVPGYVYVQTGLLDYIKDDPNMRAELAAVISHELGHTGGRHIAKQIREQNEATVGSTIFDIFTKGQYSGVIDTSADLFLLGHSRNDEYDADRRGINTLMRAGDDPEAMIEFFRKLAAKYKDGAQYTEYFNTHPLTKDRIDRAEQEIKDNEANGIPPPTPG